MKQPCEFNVKLGKKIKQLRDIHGMTQMDLAFKLGYESTGMVSQIEHGLKGMSLERIRLCSKIFKIPMSQLLSDADYSKEDMALLDKIIDIIDSPADKRHKHYEAIKLLLEHGS